MTTALRRQYLHGDPDNVIAFAIVCCCAECDASGVVEAPNLSPLGA